MRLAVILKRLRGELFALLTLAVTFVLATIILNTKIDGGPGVYLSAVPLDNAQIGAAWATYDAARETFERLVGSKRFAVYYLVCVVTAALTQLAVQHLEGDIGRPTVGASGGIFGLLLAYGLAFPHRKLMLIFPPIPMPAWLFVTLYGLVELYLGVSGRNTGVAHFAHLGGMIGGFVLIAYWRYQRLSRR